MGEAAFTKSGLALYDALVLGLVCRLLWRCPTRRILDLYRTHLSVNHLEVGVGTGYFLAHSNFPANRPRVGLLDLNENCLDRTKRRIARYAPQTYLANVLAPINIESAGFDSISLNYVLHCLPGKLPGKGIVFAHLTALLKPGGVLFGSTVLRAGTRVNAPALIFMRFLNTRKLFCNADDKLDGLVQALEEHLVNVRVEVVGCVALFSGRRKESA